MLSEIYLQPLQYNFYTDEYSSIERLGEDLYSLVLNYDFSIVFDNVEIGYIKGFYIKSNLLDNFIEWEDTIVEQQFNDASDDLYDLYCLIKQNERIRKIALQNFYYINEIKIYKEYRGRYYGSTAIMLLSEEEYTEENLNANRIFLKAYPIEENRLNEQDFINSYKNLIRFYKNLGFKRITRDNFMYVISEYINQ